MIGPEIELMSETMKVLIVDDSELMRKGLSEMISQVEGVEIVGKAERSQEAIEAIQKLKPNVVILDIKMPGGNGIGVLEHIKKNNTNTKVIMFTNYPYPQYRKKCMDLGADYFFDKSTEFEEVVEVLRGLLKC